ncbi:MAG: hypothetical protein ACRBBS_11620 [Thalassovita sp.]
MGVADELADKLAKDAIEAAETLGDDLLIDQIAKSLGDSSTTTQEAFLTSIRVRQAERRARRFLNAKIEAALKSQSGDD